MTHVTLLGAETVDQAARNMSGAAETMLRAATYFDDVAMRLMAAMDESARRMEAAAERIEKARASSQEHTP